MFRNRGAKLTERRARMLRIRPNQFLLESSCCADPDLDKIQGNWAGELEVAIPRRFLNRLAMGVTNPDYLGVRG